MIYHKSIFYSILFFLIVSCSDDDKVCKYNLIDTTSLEEQYRCSNTKFNMDIDLSNEFKVITNQSDFDQQVSGDCQPEIDFETYDLVIGKAELPSGNDSIAYQYIDNCKANTFVLKVTFSQNETFIAQNLTYHQLVPKLRGNALIDVQIVLD